MLIQFLFNNSADVVKFISYKTSRFYRRQVCCLVQVTVVSIKFNVNAAKSINYETIPKAAVQKTIDDLDELV